MKMKMKKLSAITMAIMFSTVSCSVNGEDVTNQIESEMSQIIESGISSPTQEEMQPDKPFKPFDPSTDDSGFVPPPFDENWSPLPPDYVPPPMPDLLTEPPEIPFEGENPFEAPK